MPTTGRYVHLASTSSSSGSSSSMEMHYGIFADKKDTDDSGEEFKTKIELDAYSFSVPLMGCVSVKPGKALGYSDW
jgi:hypothetical protein